MKKKFRLRGLDCADCAAKIERAINKIDGVSGATVNFVTQNLVIDADGEKFGEIMKRAAKICRDIEPDCIIL